jgi:hypothetical protein
MVIGVWLLFALSPKPFWSPVQYCPVVAFHPPGA